MLQRLSLWLFLVCTSSSCCMCAIADKKEDEKEKGPKLTVYVSAPEAGGMDFYDTQLGMNGFVTYEETDRFVCFKPEDTQSLLNYCALDQKK